MIFCAAFLVSSQAEVFKWKDADGNLHYSDQRPISGGEHKLHSAPSPVAAPPPAAKSVAEKEMEFRKRQLEAEENRVKQEKLAAEAKDRERNCNQARGSLKNLESGVRLVKVGSNGEPVYIEDNERPAMIEDAKKAVASWCQ